MARTVRTKLAPLLVFMFPVVSSNVASIGHNGECMFVQYIKDKNTNTVYKFEIDLETYEKIRTSESVGKAIYATGLKGIKM